MCLWYGLSGSGSTTVNQNAKRVNIRNFRDKYRNQYIVSDEAINLIEEPPQRQVIRSQSCEWEDANLSRAKSDLGRVILIIKTIRNNMFHGGKSSQKDWDNPERNIFLIQNALKVLEKLALLGGIESDYRRSY